MSAGAMDYPVMLPPEPCVVLSDGETVTIVTDRSSAQALRYAQRSGPILRATMSARLRALVELIEGVES